jgi:hypothetical protein
VKKRQVADHWATRAGATPYGEPFVELRLERQPGDPIAAFYLTPAYADQLREALRQARHEATAAARIVRRRGVG